MKLATLIALLAMATPAVAQTTPIIYTETFEAGQEVDINQGFYVCQISNPRDLMARLMEVQDDTARRQLGASGGCAYRYVNRDGPKYKVLRETGTICWKRQIMDGETVCTDEGHQLVVERNGREVVVMTLTRDTDYD